MVLVFQAEKDSINLLIQVGFTETQAKLYLTLINIGKTDAKTLSKQANVPRQATYRALGELQERGLVEKIISLPQEYKAVPLQDGLAIMVKEKANAYQKMTSEVTDFLAKYEEQQQAPAEEKYLISIVEGKETIVKKSKQCTNDLKEEMCILTTYQRWTHIKMEMCEEVEKALKRGAKYRVIVEKPATEITFPKEFKKILLHSKYEMRIVPDKLKMNACLFDDKIASFSLYPSRTLTETPMIWTNHPSLLVGVRDHFENLWKTAEKVNVKERIKQ
jgi:HTH-type transcriptional regulator, sugar sensing transcriptional regulator